MILNHVRDSISTVFPPPTRDIVTWLNYDGAMFVYGGLGDGKSYSMTMIGAILAAETGKPLVANYPIDVINLRVFLRELGYRSSQMPVVREYSVVERDPSVWNEPNIILLDEIGYYMEAGRKMKVTLLRDVRMARKRRQTVIGSSQELLHHRYRFAFKYRIQVRFLRSLRLFFASGVSMQTPVDSRRPGRSLFRFSYALNPYLAQAYDSWWDFGGEE